MTPRSGRLGVNFVSNTSCKAIILNPLKYPFQQVHLRMGSENLTIAYSRIPYSTKNAKNLNFDLTYDPKMEKSFASKNKKRSASRLLELL